MSNNFSHDMNRMHTKFGVAEVIENMDEATLAQFIFFRIKQLEEELQELKNAETADDAVDALIDLSVFAIGTLDVMGVDTVKAWDCVFEANMGKAVGIKEGRENPMGLPDLMKPLGWQAPSHKDNVGLFSKVYDA